MRRQSFCLILIILLTAVYIQLEGQQLNLEVLSVLDTNFLNSQYVKGIIDLPADKLLVLTSSNIYIVSLTINSNGSARLSPGQIELSITSNKNNSLIGVMLLNESHVLVTLNGQHCLKAVDLNDGELRTHAGNCNEPGATNGRRLDARFMYPNDMLMVYEVIYITGHVGALIRIMDGEQVSTPVLKYDTDSIGSPLFLFSCDGLLIYMTFRNGLAQFNILKETVDIISGSTMAGYEDSSISDSKFGWPYGLTVLVSDFILMVDRANNRLRSIGLSNNAVWSVCDGRRISVDGQFASCSLNEPIAIHLYKNLILIGELGKIRTIQRNSFIYDDNYEVFGCRDVTGAPVTTTITDPTNEQTTITDIVIIAISAILVGVTIVALVVRVLIVPAVYIHKRNQTNQQRRKISKIAKDDIGRVAMYEKIFKNQDKTARGIDPEASSRQPRDDGYQAIDYRHGSADQPMLSLHGLQLNSLSMYGTVGNDFYMKSVMDHTTQRGEIFTTSMNSQNTLNQRHSSLQHLDALFPFSHIHYVPVNFTNINQNQ